MRVLRVRARSMPVAWSMAIAIAASVLAPLPVAAADPAGSGLRTLPSQATTPTRRPTGVIVRYRETAGPVRRAAARGRSQVAAVRALESARLELVRPVRGQSVAAAVRSLNADPAVAYAEPDYPVSLAGDPGAEPLRAALQWGLENGGGACLGLHSTATCRADIDIDALGGWTAATGAGVTVAVLDDGLDFGHPDLQGRAWVNPGESGDDGLGGDRATNGLDDDANGFVDDVNGVNLCDDAATRDLHVPGADWHGTAVASVIGAATNGGGMAGVAPDAALMAVRWLVEGACDTTFGAIAAIDYAVGQGANIINASWGTYEYSAALLEAVQRANAAGVLIVAAAGNDGTTQRFYPAAFDVPNVLSIAAIRPDGYLAGFSNRGSTVDIAAPGYEIVAAYVEGGSDGYALVDGTSFAAPHVAGIAALVGEVQPALLANAAAMRSRLINSGWRNSRIDEGITHYGRVADATYAVDLTPPSAPASVTVKAHTGSSIGSSSASMAIGWAASTDANGIDSYRVRYRRSGATAWTTLSSATTTQSASVSLAYGTAYELEVTARDRGGNYASTVVPVSPRLYSESSTRATFGGTWSTARSSLFSGGRARYATTAGRWAQFAITGRSFAWVSAKGPSRGSAKVYVDGAYRTTISLYSSASAYRRVVFATSWSAVGSHTVRIVVSGTRGHPRVDVDAVVIVR